MDNSGIGHNANTYYEDMATNGLDYFSEPSADKTLSTFVERTYKPINSLTSEGPIQILIGGKDFKLHTVMSGIRVQGCINVTKLNNQRLDQDEQISVVNTFVHSLFDHIKVCVDNIPISDHSRYYQYKSYIQTHYSYSSQWKAINGLADYYCKDGIVNQSIVNFSEEGLIERQPAIAESRKMFFCFYPYVDLFSSDCYFPPNHTLSLEFYRARDTFSLIATDTNANYKINFIDFSVKARHVVPNTKLNIELERKLSSNQCHFAFQRTQIKSYQMHAGKIDISIPNLFTGVLPRQVMIVMVNNTAVNGSIKHNPFVFTHYQLDNYSLVINGHNYPTEGVKFDYDQGDVVSAYQFFLDNIGINHSDTEIGVNINEYCSGSFCMAFDLSPDLCNGGHHHQPLDGILEFRAFLKKPLDESITLLVMAVHDSHMTINKDGGIGLDYVL